MQKDLNMPVAVPHRKGAPESFAKDTPLTCVGETQARLLGEALRLRDIDVAHVFCSPSLRSMQTCRNILRGLQVDQRTPIAHEPGLFEWLAWYVQRGTLSFPTEHLFSLSRFNADGGPTQLRSYPKVKYKILSFPKPKRCVSFTTKIRDT